MKITADRDQLAAAVARAAQGLPQNPVMPVRAGMLLRVSGDHAHLACGDEDVMFIARMPLMDAGTHDDPAGCVLPGKLLDGLVRLLPQHDVVIELGSGHVTFACGRASFTLKAEAEAEYPMWLPPPAPLCTLDGAELAAGLRKVVPAASDDLPHLSGVLMELDGDMLTLAATDKYKLGAAELDVLPAASQVPGTMPDAPAFLPSRVAEKFARACEGQADVGWDGSLVSLHAAGLLVSARQVAGRMPDGWRGILDDGGGAWYACETAELARAVRMALLAGDPDAGGKDTRTELAFSGEGEVTVSAGGARQAAECEYDGEPVILTVGGRNLLAGLQGCGELVRLAFSAPRRPLLLDSEGLRWLVQTRTGT